MIPEIVSSSLARSTASMIGVAIRSEVRQKKDNGPVLTEYRSSDISRERK